MSSLNDKVLEFCIANTQQIDESEVKKLFDGSIQAMNVCEENIKETADIFREKCNDIDVEAEYKNLVAETTALEAENDTVKANIQELQQQFLSLNKQSTELENGEISKVREEQSVTVLQLETELQEIREQQKKKRVVYLNNLHAAEAYHNENLRTISAERQREICNLEKQIRETTVGNQLLRQKCMDSKVDTSSKLKEIDDKYSKKVQDLKDHLLCSENQLKLAQNKLQELKSQCANSTSGATSSGTSSFLQPASTSTENISRMEHFLFQQRKDMQDAAVEESVPSDSKAVPSGAVGKQKRKLFNPDTSFDYCSELGDN